MKRNNKNDHVNGSYRSSNIRYLARCPVCLTRVKGRPTAFHLSSSWNHVVFDCPCCHADAIVNINELERVELAVEIETISDKK